MLDKRLSGNGFVIFDSPTELDSTLYAYITIIMNVLPHSHVLRSHVNECPHLLQFVHAYHQKYFACDLDLLSQNNNSYTNIAEERQLDGSGKSKDLEEGLNSSKWIPSLFAVLIAGGAMLLFGSKKGILISH